jgi:hypothetical protein
MNNRREYADAYAETLVLPEKRDTLPAGGDDRDPLALYEEYARELTGQAATSARTAAARAKR